MSRAAWMDGPCEQSIFHGNKPSFTATILDDSVPPNGKTFAPSPPLSNIVSVNEVTGGCHSTFSLIQCQIRSRRTFRLCNYSISIVSPFPYFNIWLSRSLFRYFTHVQRSISDINPWKEISGRKLTDYHWSLDDNLESIGSDELNKPIYDHSETIVEILILGNNW